MIKNHWKVIIIIIINRLPRSIIMTENFVCEFYLKKNVLTIAQDDYEAHRHE